MLSKTLIFTGYAGRCGSGIRDTPKVNQAGSYSGQSSCRRPSSYDRPSWRRRLKAKGRTWEGYSSYALISKCWPLRSALSVFETAKQMSLFKLCRGIPGRGRTQGIHRRRRRSQRVTSPPRGRGRRPRCVPFMSLSCSDEISFLVLAQKRVLPHGAGARGGGGSSVTSS